MICFGYNPDLIAWISPTTIDVFKFLFIIEGYIMTLVRLTEPQFFAIIFRKFKAKIKTMCETDKMQDDSVKLISVDSSGPSVSQANMSVLAVFNHS